MTAKQMWELYGGEGEYTAWQYGCVPDKLAELTLNGTKRATASAYPVYIAEGEAIPKVGGHSVILNANDEAVCIIRTTRVRIIPFKDVPEEFAATEGEGDKTLRYWREVHIEFFVREMEAIGQTFTDEMPVICEEFECVYP